MLHVLKPPCVKNDSIATFYAFVARSAPRWPWSLGSLRAVHTGSTQDHSRLKQLQQQDPSAQSTQPTTVGEGQLRHPTWPSSSSEHQGDSSTAEPQLIAYCESQGRPLVPRLGTQLWQATFSGNVPTQWWQDTSSTSSTQQQDADSAAGISSSTPNAAISYRPTSWSELCRSSSYIHQHFRWVPSRRLSPFATPQPFPVQLSGHISAYRPRPRAEVNRLAYVEQLHRALMGLPPRVPRRFRAAYTHRQTLRLRLQQERLGLQQRNNSTTGPTTHSVPALKAAPGPISPQSLPVRHQATGISQQQQQQQQEQQQQQHEGDWRQQQWQLHDTASDPPLLTWRQFQQAKQRRCRLRSQRVADTWTWQQFTIRLGITAAATAAPRSQSDSPWMQDRLSDSSSDSSSPSQPSSALDDAPAAYQLAAKLAACPAGSLNPSQAHSGGARRCVAQRDEAGNLVPLPAMCIGAGCSSNSSSSSETTRPSESSTSSSTGCGVSSMDTHAGSGQQPSSGSSSQDGSSGCSDSVPSRCVAGIGCDQMAQPVLLEQPAEEPPAPAIGRRRFWGRRWLHSSRAPAAGPEQQPARGPGSSSSSSSRGAGEGRNALRNKSSSGLSMPCPSCAAKPGALAKALRQQMDHQLSPWHRPAGPDSCAMCGCPAPHAQQRPAGQSAAGALPEWPQGVVLAGLVVAPGWHSGQHEEQIFMPHSGAAMHPDSIPAADADSSDDSSYSSEEDSDYEDHGYDDDDDAYSDTDSDDEDDDGPSPEVLAAQAAPYTFRNQHDIIYGFWSKCPLG